MTFVSYAQNFEDVLLWRALGHVERGFYIDVGAWSPDLDSVTRAFSDRGWRGINIEPNPAYFSQLVERRPADANLCVALGDRSGSVVMNFIAGSGLSTADEGIALGHAEMGMAMTSQQVALTTLASVWQSHVPDAQDVHFLKVDVEGFEKAVLAGNDWTRNRPWIVVVEATLPASQIESHDEWEGLLLQAGYAHVYSDGLNRYYVAQERAHLKSAFRNPPNVFDGFVTAEVQALRDGLRRQETELVAAQRRVELAETSAIDARRREHQIKASASVEAGELRRAISTRDRLIEEANQRAADWAQQHRAVLESNSWRAVAALRRLMSIVPQPVLRQAKRAAKLGWWVVTPWRMPARLKFLRARREASAGVLDLTSDSALLNAAGVSREHVLWAPQSPAAVVDKWSAARLVIDLLRTRPDVRARFPRALSESEASGFAQWLVGDEADLSGLPASSKQQLQQLLQEDLAARARQLFLFRTDVRAGLPHGLTPPGQIELFRWFVRHGMQELDLRSEEVLWLFMQAAENPALELVRAYLFTPEWQERHRDALTVFGCAAFAQWFAASYPVAGAHWLKSPSWPARIPASVQLRQAYGARPEWQTLHPGVFESVAAARTFVDWLQSGSAALEEDVRVWCGALNPQKMAEELVAGGVNVIAHFCSPSGVRVSAEALVEGMRRMGIRTSLRDLKTDILDEPNHVRFDGLEDFDITLIHTQPEPFFERAYPLSDLNERSPRTYRIAYWYWEFDSVPASWADLAAGVDEVWAATEFVAKGLRERLRVPVRTLFPGVRLGTYQRRDKKHFGIEEGTFAFLFNFHMNSVMERKNPLGLIKAFKAAFRPEEPVSLVLKTMFGHHNPAQLAQLHEAAAGARITVINEMYTPDEVLSLTDACDAYISLHRSEGLGLTMAEAMLMGKPVIATNYSGNVDFMNETNSLLVPYELVRLGRTIPPYDADLLWAEPSIERAAAWMRRLVDEPDWARDVGARAKASAEASLSIDVAGRKVAQRLAEIRLLRASRTRSDATDKTNLN